ncbi:hypothetical protein Cni_G07328 [Canna indica]|uniref:WRKY domain-containing protein n=1 Tax=Canna indica TaxID=4628 RepID=A0AAQ3JYX9_9LILI|nr:hypothetical protein Cni_G07328 [Canna indica]
MKVDVEGVSGGSRDEGTGEFDAGAQICSRDSSKSSPPFKTDLNSNSVEEDHIESSKVSEVGEENIPNSQTILTDYLRIAKHEKEEEEEEEGGGEEESELVSLRLGTSESCNIKKEDKAKNVCSKHDKIVMNEGLSLGLEYCKSVGHANIERSPIREPCPTNKRTHNESNDDNAYASADEEVPLQPALKRTRVSVRARCDGPTMNDGCQWRKYGQKIAKGNPCPRAYYRCTIAPGCPVRKQVQRCAGDLSILITTYEGSHNHPLPLSATAMASTTAAAASMLVSGSTSSSTAAFNIHGANISMSNGLMHSSPNLSTYNSSINSHPTITLDLTSPSSTPQIKFSQNSLSSRYSSDFNFSNSESNKLLSWSNGHLSYGGAHQPYPNKSGSEMTPLSLGVRQPEEAFTNSYLPKMSDSSPYLPSQHALTDMIAGAIKSHPSFQSALATALTSYIGRARGDQGVREGLNYSQQQQQQQIGCERLASPPTTQSASRYLTILNSVSSPNQRQ